MQSQTDIAQIYLTHPKNENFSTLFCEAFQRQGETVELFAVLELENAAAAHELRLQRAECEKLAGTLIGALKKTYITSPSVDHETFEKALAAANAALAKMLRSNKTRWFTHLNACLAALHRGELSLAAAGTSRILLERGGELTDLGRDLAETAADRPAKIFSNYSTGRLRSGDRVILSSKELFNYVSLERLREYLREDTVAETAKETIAALGDVKTAGFAAFIFEAAAPTSRGEPRPYGRGAAGEMSAAPKSARSGADGNFANFGKVALTVLLASFDLLWRLARGLFTFVFRSRSDRRRSGAKRKWLKVLIILLLLALAINVAVGLVRRSRRQRQTAQTEQFKQIGNLVQDAESALIYGDEKSAVENINRAGELLKTNPNDDLNSRVLDLKNKLNKTVALEQATALAAFAAVPTDLYRSPNGVLARNRDTGRAAYYDFASGAAKTILQNQNLSRITGAAYAGGDNGYIFSNRDGAFSRLDLANDTLLPFGNATSTAGAAQTVNLGAGSGARLYLLDRQKNQIWRVRIAASGVGPAEGWFKTSPDLSAVIDLAVDGSIYLLKGAAVEKYFNGEKQPFSLSPAIPALTSPAGIFTTDEHKSIYVLDPKQSRLLAYDKAGKLQRQYTNDKFRDAADLYVDESAKIIYLISGSELLQIKMP